MRVFVCSTTWCACFLCLSRKLKFLVSQETLQLSREPVPPCRCPQQALMRFCSWRRSPGSSSSGVALHTGPMRAGISGRVSADGLLRWPGWNGGHPNSPNKWHFAAKAWRSQSRTAACSQWTPLSYPATGRGSGTGGPWYSSASCIPAGTALCELIFQHNSHSRCDSFPRNNNAIVNARCEAGEGRPCLPRDLQLVGTAPE